MPGTARLSPLRLSSQSVRSTRLSAPSAASPLAAALKAWAETILPQLSGISALANAFRYMLVRWTALTSVLSDDRIGLDNNPVERALWSVAVGRKNYLVAGSDQGAERAAAL